MRPSVKNYLRGEKETVLCFFFTYADVSATLESAILLFVCKGNEELDSVFKTLPNKLDSDLGGSYREVTSAAGLADPTRAVFNGGETSSARVNDFLNCRFEIPL